MSSITLTAAAARRALTAIWQLTMARGREWCTTAEIAEHLGVGTRDAIVRLDHLEELDLVALLGSTSRYQRRWQLTPDGVDAVDAPAMPKHGGAEGSD